VTLVKNTAGPKRRGGKGARFLCSIQSTLPYSLELIDKPGYLHARVTGVNSTEAVVGYTHDVHKACVERRCRVLLIEENLSGPSIDLSSIFQVVADRSRQVIGVSAMDRLC